jgi:protein-S-isoprenylcysteine O-methyltransferase Ste14
MMLKVPPPIWALIYVLIASAISWWLGWPNIPGLPFVPLGIALVAVGCISPVWAIFLFRREGTEVSPTSPTNHKLVLSGPYQFTRNPCIWGSLYSRSESQCG